VINVLDDLADGSVEAHTSIVLAYNVDLLVYDKLVRRRLASAGVTNQIVICDATAYAASLDAIDAASRVGRAYSVTPVRVQGAFHPKAYLLLGRQRGRLVIGSGNASLGGLVRNAEVFGRFDFDATAGSSPHPAFREVFALARNFGSTLLPAVRAQLARAEQWTPWLGDRGVPDGRVVRVGGLGGEPLMDAISARASAVPLRRIIAMSSSFDRKLKAVGALAAVGRGDHETIVIVQPDRLNMDGAAVDRLGDAVKWSRFSDPRPSKKKEPRDSYAHAKLVLVETRTADHLFFGSANLSSPALLTGTNIEIVVELPPEPPGTWVKQLGLGESLKVDARPALAALKWKEEPDERDDGLTALMGAEWQPGEGWIVIVEGKLPAAARLALGIVRNRAEQFLPLQRRKDGTTLAPARAAADGVRFAWLVDTFGRALSRPVALTWPDVARARLGGWFGARVEQAILSMKHGELLGHVLFEFLDRIPDFGVLAVTQLRRAAGSTSRKDEAIDERDRTEESFYTDATAASEEMARFALGDRSDLDLLAALVQPLDSGAKNEREQDDDEEEDDVGIEEEAERRKLDTSKSADGSEREATSRVPSAKRMQRAGRRFARRVERAASALGDTLEAIDDALVLPPGLIARQVWMTFIAAFVAGRLVETCDEEDQVVVEPDVLASYVLRCATMLAGDARGGLLRHVDVSAWPTREGQTLADGLRFIVAVCAWATAWFEAVHKPSASTWHEDEPDYAAGIHDAIPVFVLARFLVAAGAHVAEPDFDDAARRVSAWDEVPFLAVQSAYRRARELARWLSVADIDAASDTTAGEPVPGSAVHLRKAGVGIVVAAHDGTLRVAMLGRPKRPFVPFSTAKTRPVRMPDVGRVLLAPVEPDSAEG
jgi:hypothetical protein